MLVTSPLPCFFCWCSPVLVCSCGDKRQDDHAMPEHLISSFWVGWALLILFLQIWQLFAPVGVVSLAMLFIAGGRDTTRPAGAAWLGENGFERRGCCGGWVQRCFFNAAGEPGCLRPLFLRSRPVPYADGEMADHFPPGAWAWVTCTTVLHLIIHLSLCGTNECWPFEGLAHQTASTLLVFMLVGRCLYRSLPAAGQQGNQARFSNTVLCADDPVYPEPFLHLSFAGYSTDM
jgi:hypothetical protein